MSAEENKAIVLRRYEQPAEKDVAAVVDEFCAADYVWHLPFGPELDREAAKQLLAELGGAFPDLDLTIEDTIAEGDKVVLRWTARGTHKGEFQSIAATGKQVTWTGITIYRVEGGKITEERVELDMLGFRQQLGAIPAS